MESIVAQSYGEALFLLAKEEDILEQFRDELNFLETLMKKENSFFQLLNYPKIAKEEKKHMICQVFENKIHPLLLNFLKLLIDKSRIFHLNSMIAIFNKKYNAEKGIEIAYVSSAKTLTSKEIDRLQAMLEMKRNKKIDMRIVVDSSLLAGIKVQINDTLLDYTAISKLDSLKHSAYNIKSNH